MRSTPAPFLRGFRVTSTRTAPCADRRSPVGRMARSARRQPRPKGSRQTHPLAFKCGSIRLGPIGMLDSGDGKRSHRWRTCTGIRTTRLDTSATQAVGVDLARSLGAPLLSGQLVTFLPPPVGGLPRSLPGNPVGGRERSSCLGRCTRRIGGLAGSPLFAFCDFVRYGTSRR